MTRQTFWFSGDSAGEADASPATEFAGLRGYREGEEVSIVGAEAHHATVKRLRLGEVVDVVDGLGWRVGAEVVAAQNSRLRLRLLADAVADPVPPLRLTLIQALAKEKRDLQALESAVEMGAWRVIPWGATRSVSRWDTVSKRAKGREKWRNLAVSAMKQSRQARLAEVSEYLESGGDIVPEPQGAETRSVKSAANTIFSEVEAMVQGGTAVFVLHEVATEHLAQMLIPLARAGQTPEDIAVIVGPEGGITAPELTAFTAAGALPALLGPTVLRCSSAGPAALAVIQSQLGSWRGMPPESR
ncbi:RsmE family RNA methyltransferase [Mobiluncus curtisii]|uniref:RsmE family RNA methyltransferase n=1 Tax=Mobiluncus curtisii TaxID=2051 RepID=UPI00242B5279|nr:RsmE family RNA methyltransferase [Mobiluncus curtisii]